MAGGDDSDIRGPGPGGDRPPTRDAGGAGGGPTLVDAPSVEPGVTPPHGQPPVDATGDGPGREPPAARSPLRHRVLPRTLLGITSLILALAVGAAFSGVVLFSYYQYRLDQTNAKVNDLINGYTKQFQNAEAQLGAQTNQAKSQIQAQLAPLQDVIAQANTVQALVKLLSPALYFVHTLDQAGQPSVGTAFVVSSNRTQSLLLTSYTTVIAATHSPGPQVFIQQGSTSTAVTVRSWDPTYDMAVIVLPEGNLPVIPVAAAGTSIGQRVFALSGLGTDGSSVSQGAVTDVSADGIQHNAPVSDVFQGGPLVNAQGQALGLVSRTYSPLGFSTDEVWFSPNLNEACKRVLHCPSGKIANST